MSTFRICFISGKLGGTDGVSLEVDKWIHVLKELGHEIFTLAGNYINPVKNVEKDHQFELKEIRFDSPEQLHMEKQLFPFISNHTSIPDGEQRVSRIVDDLKRKGNELAIRMHDLMKQHSIDVIIAENTNAMPMTLLGGMAVYQLAVNYRMATIFHHHDFWWERSRFSANKIESLLNQIMPPFDLGVEHTVLTSYSAHILRSLKRVQPMVVPNCEDFDHPVEKDEYNADFRKELGFKDDDILIIQPTRIVRRKRIEDSIRLIGRFAKKYPEYKDRIQYVISLYQGDEPDNNYINQIKNLAEENGIPLHMISDRVAAVRGEDNEGRKMYTNRDVLINADLATFLPIWEGFGNALLEAIACKIPVVTTTYLVYKTDIQSAGMHNIEVRDRYDKDGQLIIEDKVLAEMNRALTDPAFRKDMVEKNFAAGKKEFGYETLKNLLNIMIENYQDEIKASRRRLDKTKVMYSV